MLFSKSCCAFRCSEENLQFLAMYRQVCHVSFSRAVDEVVGIVRIAYERKQIRFANDFLQEQKSNPQLHYFADDQLDLFG